MRERIVPGALARGVAFVAVLVMASGLAAAQTVRGHSIHHGGHSGGHHYYGGGGYGFYASWYYLPHYYPYGYYYPPYPPYPVYYGASYLPDVAYIDTDIRPEKAEVWLDGEYVGIADNYDGFPSYLSVTPGKHTLTFKADGFRTVTRNLRVPRGVVLDLDFALPKGTGSEPPASGKGDEEIVVPEYNTRAGQEGARDRSDAADPNADEGESDDDEPAPAEPGFVRLHVTPPDASVYLDGKLLGSASSMASLHGEMRLESGRHRIEAVRPGYRPVRRDVDIRPGDHLTLTMDLESETPRQAAPR